MDAPIVARKKTCVDCGAALAGYYAVRCRSCMTNTMRKPESAYHAAALEKEITWLGPYTGDTHAPTEWRCANDHVWSTPLHGLKGCPICAYEQRSESLRLAAERYQELAERFGVTWLGPEAKNNRTKTAWRCPMGHEWMDRYSNFAGCPKCAVLRRAESRSHSDSDYENIAKERGYKWLGPKVSSVHKKTQWQCPNGHVWEARFLSIQQGYECFACSHLARGERKRADSEKHQSLAAARGFLWIGELPKNNKTPTEWQCSEGHRWLASSNNISRGSGCPLCLEYVNGVRVSKQQRALCDMLGGELNYRVGRYTVDVALITSDAKIACEYDAHYWHANHQDRDLKRVQSLISRGWKVLAVKSRRLLPSAGQVQDAIGMLLGGGDYYEIMLSDWGVGVN